MTRTGFHAKDWAQIREFLGGMAERDARFGHLVDIVDSVLASGIADQLGATTSMHDLLVVPLPLPEPPFDMIAVRAPSALHLPPPGLVLIEHLTLPGRNDRIFRPTEESVPLFWRFVREKFGLAPIP